MGREERQERQPSDKYAVLADSLDWATNVGYPGYSNAAVTGNPSPVSRCDGDGRDEGHPEGLPGAHGRRWRRSLD
ncbi:MAG: hypothetical protein E6J62_20070, partial [Deltaproteobacteria bacterium]